METGKSDLQFFRYEWTLYAAHDYDGELCSPQFPNPQLELKTFDIIKETNKGFWVGYGDVNYKRWVSKTAKKRYAYPTEEEAMINFIARTKRRMKILQYTIDCCSIALSRAETKTKLTH